MTVVPTPDHLQYLGTVQGPRRGSLGDPELGQGLALRPLPDGGLIAYLGESNPGSTILQGVVPASFTGLIALRRAGTLPCQYGFPNGLFWDAADQALYLTCHNAYDATSTIDPTLSRGRFTPDGTLVSDGQWAFANRSDKMTDGGVCLLPDGTLGIGFGMYRSVVATGPASMGLALARCLRPTVGVSPTVTPLLGYAYRAGGIAPRMHRSPDYINLCADGYPIDPTHTGQQGVTTWSDYGIQCATWIQTEALSGFVGLVMRNTGRSYYANAQVKADGWRYDWVAYDDTILGGGAQDAHQPALDIPFVFPGMPVNGPNNLPAHPIKGVTWEPINRLLAFRVQGMFGTDAATQADGLVFFRVVDPLMSFDVRRTSLITEHQTVKALDEADAIGRAVSAGAWGQQDVTTSLSAVKL
jgi:hypothetical protein